MYLALVANSANAQFNIEKIHKNTLVSSLDNSRENFVLWQSMLQSLSNSSVKDKLKSVNQFFAKTLRYRMDTKLYGVEDYWAPLSETIMRGAGDCEDFAIAKYFSLKKLGVEGDKLRLIYVNSRLAGSPRNVYQAHMVLGYFDTPDAAPYILDSLTPVIHRLSKRDDLIVKYSFNSEFLWVGKASLKLSESPNVKLAKWQAVLQQQTSVLLKS